MTDITFNPMSEEFTQDPYPHYERMRHEAPIYYYADFDSWIFFNHGDVKSILTDKRFTNDMSYWSMYQPTDPDVLPNIEYININSPFGGDQENLKHAHLSNRKMAVKVFSPSAVNSIRESVIETVYAQLESLKKCTVIDFAKDVAPNIPYAVITSMLGVPDIGNQQENFKRSCVLLADSFDPMLSPEQMKACDIGAGEVLNETRRLIKERQLRPTQDIITDFVNALIEFPELNEDHIAVTIAVLITAGARGTVMSTNMLVKTLFEHPEHMKQLRDNRELIPHAVIELLRFNHPARFLYRYALQDLDYNNHGIKKGQAVMLPTASANRDEKIFPNAAKLDFLRSTKELQNSMVFGHGHHFCVGAHLARLQIEAVINGLFDILPETAYIDSNTIEWDYNDFLARNIHRMLIHTTHV